MPKYSVLPNSAAYPIPWFGKYAARMLDNGWYVIPLIENKKEPVWKNWTKWTDQPPPLESVLKAAKKNPYFGIGITCGWQYFVIDIDAEDREEAERIEMLARGFLGATPLIRHGRSPRRSLIYGVEGAPVQSDKVGSVEVLGEGSFCVAFGIHPDTGRPYEWETDSPADIAVSQLPRVRARRVEKFLHVLELFYELDVNKCAGAAAKPKHARQSSCSRTSKHAPVSDEWDTNQKSGLVEDRRERYLTHCVYQAYCRRPKASAIDIANEAWKVFSSTADLSRPKQGGRKYWTKDDALKKARRLVKKQPRPTSACAGDALIPRFTPDEADAFCRIVREAQLDGHLTPADVRVSDAMLEYATSDGSKGTCFASVDTIVSKVGCSKSAVQQARRRLVTEGLWEILDKDEEFGTMHYCPNGRLLATAKAGREPRPRRGCTVRTPNITL